MKKCNGFCLAFAAGLLLFFASCGQSAPQEDETADTETMEEVSRLDSLSDELDSTANQIEKQVEELQEALEEL